MPYKTVFVNPQKLLTRRGLTIYHTYKDDEIDQGIRRYSFVTDPGDGEDLSFDVRDLPQFKESTPPVWDPILIRKVIIAAIDSGHLTADGVRSNATAVTQFGALK